MTGLSVTGLLVAGGLFAAGASAAVAGHAMLSRAPAGGEATATVRATVAVRSELQGGLLVKLAAPTDPSELGALQVHLLQAGFGGAHALEQFLALRSVLALVLPVLGYVSINPATTLGALALALLLSGIGYMLPAVLVGQLRRIRQRTLQRALPNMLDMLVGCVEAGLGLDAALRRVTRELAPVAPELAEQLDLVNAELSAGVARTAALSHLVDRTGLDEIESMVNVMSQAERYGTGVADAIRAHAKLLRRHRSIDAERRAAEVSPRLTVVMILFVMPAMFIVLVGPALVQVVERLLPTLTGVQ